LAEGIIGFRNQDSRVLGKKQVKNGNSVEQSLSHLHQPPKQLKLKCPECSSERLYKDGLRYNKDGTARQRWLCRDCGYRFSESKIKFDVGGQIFEGSKATENHADGIVAGLDISSKEIRDGCSFSGGKQVGSHDVSAVGKSFNTLRIYSSEHQVCANKGAKNLNPTTESKTVAGEKTQLDSKGAFAVFTAKQITQGLKEKTIEHNLKSLKEL
jgi:DNA-directed RNA polymerase subunit RPC12/RpoP